MSTTATGADPDKTAKTTKWWSIGGVIAILIVVWLLTPSSSPKGADKSEAPSALSIQYQPQPTSGHTNIVHNEWRGVQCLENGMRITAFILKPGVWWQVRFDYRDDQVYDLYPMDYKTNSMLVLTNTHKAQEWRIKPGDKEISAPVAWKITPDNIIPSR